MFVFCVFSVCPILILGGGGGNVSDVKSLAQELLSKGRGSSSVLNCSRRVACFIFLSGERYRLYPLLPVCRSYWS